MSSVDYGKLLARLDLRHPWKGRNRVLVLAKSHSVVAVVRERLSGHGRFSYGRMAFLAEGAWEFRSLSRSVYQEGGT